MTTERTTIGTENQKPSYYEVEIKGIPIECFDVIKALGLDTKYFAATALKYIFRMGKKPGAAEISDCEKAIVMLQGHLQILKAKKIDNLQTTIAKPRLWTYHRV